MSKVVIDAQIRHEIERLVYEHAWMIDNHRSEGLAELYTEDGRLYGIEPERKGRAALQAYGRDRAKRTDITARHVVTNLRLTPMDDGRISGEMFIILLRHVGPGIGTADPCALADAHDIYVKDRDGKWKIAERRLQLTFESESHKIR